MAMHDREVITELANLLRTSGDWILEEGVKLSLTSVSLSILNEGFRKLENYRLQQIDTSTGVAPVNLVLANKGDDDKNRIFDDLTFLYAFIPKISALKVIHGTSTIQGPICLEEFRNLQVLEVKKVPVHLLSGIEKLQLQLCTIICSRCIQAAQDLFEACGGDMCSAHMWPKLTTVSLSSNNLDTLDGSFRLLPAVKTLDLSQNMLRNTENYLENLTNLHYVNLSCNRLVHVPTFSVTAKHRLVKLILSNNNLDNIDGIQELINLVELDLSGNCLCTHDKINLLCYLHRLNVLNLRENPLAYHANHRLLTVQYLSPVAAKELNFYFLSYSIAVADRTGTVCFPTPFTGEEHWLTGTGLWSITGRWSFNGSAGSFGSDYMF
ncbi:serine/threonine-protein kinase 11-interacting protein-like [Tubulanus polymorphus]|uniref:serine/threonine-protein kinase 11-interacting protein-like n=1 Tax=Tubulanus polymorphus TaxID=672921 RepID=UPI003DA5CBAB